MAKPRVELMAIGNAIVDVIAEASDDFLKEQGLAKGSMQLIDSDRAQQLYDRMAPTREMSGGSAANTVAALAMLGHTCSFTGQVADDQLGEIFVHDIRASGVEFANSGRVNSSPTARSLILVTPDGQRTMNTHLGASQMLSVSAIKAPQIAEAGALYLEGYLWDAQMPREAMRRAIEIAHSADRHVILTLSDAWLVERHLEDFTALLKSGAIDVLFANRQEALAFAGTDDIQSAIAQLRELVALVVVTDGPNGALCFTANESCMVAADSEVEVVDTTGAGDAFAAGFLSGYLRGWNYRDSLELGTLCAAEVISHFGPRPEADLGELARSRFASGERGAVCAEAAKQPQSHQR